MLKGLHKNKHVNEPSFGTWGESAETKLKKGGGGKAGRGEARGGGARWGEARQGETGRGKVGRGGVERGGARCGGAKLGRAGQGEARQGEAFEPGDEWLANGKSSDTAIGASSSARARVATNVRRGWRNL